ncbi:MAG: FecR domain-containing protein [Butyrivibrio sp.]
MNKNKISGKMIAIIAAAVAVIGGLAIFLVMNFSKKDTSYRSIQIYELEGTAVIERESIGTIAAVENLYLESGDRISVAEDSHMRLKLDDDKYIMVEENSVLTLVAEGTRKESKTSIYLEKGAIINEIQNKLNENSSYDVTTPNSVMAVRGTVFRVCVYSDDNKDTYTKVSTYEGKVDSKLVLPDGTKAEDTVTVEYGHEVIIYMDTDKTEYISEPQEINYNEMPQKALEFLKDVMANGTELADITAEEIDRLINREETESYTVTFLYNGMVFGTQTVQSGQKADIPKLAPSQNGGWDYDFTKPVTEDIFINWK